MNDSGKQYKSITEQKPRSSFANTLQVQSYQLSSKMEKIINNPGLQHLAEKIFWDLDIEHLKICEQINESSRQILDNAMFWIKKIVGLSKKNREDWIKVIQTEKNSDKEKSISSYLKWHFKKGPMIDLPCYASPDVQEDFRTWTL